VTAIITLRALKSQISQGSPSSPKTPQTSHKLAQYEICEVSGPQGLWDLSFEFLQFRTPIDPYIQTHRHI
jgi:hypothetical protein